MNVGFILKLKTNTRYTIRDTDFSVPGFDTDGYGHHPNLESENHGHDTGRAFRYFRFANAKIELVSDPKRSIGISAGTAWPDQEDAIPTATITVKVTPPEDADKLKDRITLEIKELTGGPGYTPSDMGTLTQDTSDKLKWTYEAFEEPSTQRHPLAKEVVIVAKLDGTKQVSSTNIVVHPVFQWLAKVPLHQHGPGAARHKLNADDYNKAWQYAKWKYDLYFPFFDVIEYSSQPGGGIRAVTQTFLGVTKCTLYQGAFQTENICASTLGHEHIHAVQQNTGSDCTSLFRGPNNCQVDAYNWEINNNDVTGILDWFKSDVLIPCRNYYNGSSNTPCGEGD